MGKRGPRPKPTALKLLEGTFRPDRAAANEPMPAPGIPRCPKSLDRDGKRAWDAVVPELQKLGLLTIIDGAVLEGYAQAYSKAVKADRAIKKHGLIVKTPWGLQTNPAVAVSRNEWAAVRKFAAEFGLTPSARSRINAQPPAPPADSTKDFLFGGRRRPA